MIKWFKAEVREVVPAIIYFCIAFNLIYFTIGLTLPAHFHRIYSYTSVTISAIILGKIIMIADVTRFLKIFQSYPMLINIIWKSIVYAFFIFSYHVLEALITLLFKFGFSSVVLHYLWLEITAPVFWAIQIWSNLFLCFFVVFKEFVIVLGPKKFKKLFFGSN